MKSLCYRQRRCSACVAQWMMNGVDVTESCNKELAAVKAPVQKTETRASAPQLRIFGTRPTNTQRRTLSASVPVNRAPTGSVPVYRVPTARVPVFRTAANARRSGALGSADQWRRNMGGTLRSFQGRRNGGPRNFQRQSIFG
ncbi:hypothetical protein BaRGS_00029985 [Batillaria attramentaria]|uniref:Uncharacterized protein n=1 Tax=Batillaria attramentaria TaxID=370345 RepID=A0ABD0JUN9_9CAEN